MIFLWATIVLSLYPERYSQRGSGVEWSSLEDAACDDYGLAAGANCTAWTSTKTFVASGFDAGSMRIEALEVLWEVGAHPPPLGGWSVDLGNGIVVASDEEEETMVARRTIARGDSEFTLSASAPGEDVEFMISCVEIEATLSPPTWIAAISAIASTIAIVFGLRRRPSLNLAEGAFGEPLTTMPNRDNVSVIFLGNMSGTGWRIASEGTSRLAAALAENRSREFETLLKLRHDNLASFVGFNHDVDGKWALWRFEGETLSDWLFGNAPSKDFSRRAVEQILEGLMYLHDNEVIHGNLTVDTVLVRDEGFRIFGAGTRRSKELISSNDALSATDFVSDVWQYANVVVHVLSDDPEEDVRPVRASRELWRILSRALSKDRTRRPNTSEIREVVREERRRK